MSSNDNLNEEDYGEDYEDNKVVDSVVGVFTQKHGDFNQKHGDIVLATNWWWAAHLTLCSVALIANLIFLVTVIYNRKSRDLKTFATAIITTLAVLDILDVLRIIPILVESLFNEVIFRHVYCTIGIFHELTVALFLVSLSIGICVQAGKDSNYSENRRASLAQKILIPVVLMLAAGAASPFFLIKSSDQLSHTCTNPFRVMNVTNMESEQFVTNLYSTLITVFTYILPLLIIPTALPIASVRTCISGQCCENRFKQPIGELIMTIFVGLVYIATVVLVVLPEIGKMIELEEVQFGPAPLLWELGNNAVRPIVYFMTNPGVWEGLKSLCCNRNRKKHQLVASGDDDEETEMALAPITTV